MKDVTDAFVAARRHGSWPVDAVVREHSAGKALEGLRIEWDRDADEEWLRVLKTTMVLGLVWVPGPLVIETTGHLEIAREVERVTGVAPQVIDVPKMDAPVLCVQPDVVWPDREWPTGAIDPAALSAHDLWYATS
jgi:hypothetical protein